MKRGLHLGLPSKIFLVCAGQALFVSVIGSALLYHGASHALREQVCEQLKRVASTAATQIDADMHSQIQALDDESGEAYKHIKVQLAAIRDANPGTRYVYTMRKKGDHGDMQFVVDAEEEPADISHVGDEYHADALPQMRRGLDEPCAGHNVITDAWGTWLSGYAPIRDKSGRSVGVIGVDMSMEQLAKQESGLRQTALRNLLLAMVTSMALSLLLARFIMRPIMNFINAAERIRNGDLDFQLDCRGPREIAQFGASINGMIAALKSSRELLLEQSTRDFMTGLYSHRYLHERLATEIERSARYSRNLCLLLIDLDKFKTVNDTFGHPIGDSILQQLGAELKHNLRSIDIPARYGGDVFAVILPETDREGGMLVAHRIRKSMENHRFYAVPIEELPADPPSPDDERTASLTVTIGFAYYPDDHATKDGLLMAADIALCRAKHTGRNTICTYDSSANGEDQVDPQDLYQMLRDPNIAAIRSLAAAVDAKDRYTSGHSERVAGFAVKLAEALGMDENMVNTVKVAGLLHDLGKIGVPDAILNKPGSLTQDEFESLRQHPSVGGNIVQRAPQLDQIIPAILHHHERYDGRGYPDGIAGEDIPLIARIMAVADSFDAMTSDRPYRKALSLDTALQELETNAGTQFDPELVETFVRRVAEERQAEAA